MTRLAFVGMLLLAASSGCRSSGGEDCPVGDAGCPCAAGTCPAGLACSNGICVFGETGDSGETATATTPGDDAPEDDSSGLPDTGTSEPEPGAPEVIELFTDLPTLAENGTIFFTAQVIDDDGLDDIVGGVLVDDETQVVYGPFTQISEGTYAAAVSWDQVDMAQPIFFEGSGARTYRAEFTDQSERVGSRTIEVPFSCDGASMAVCGDGDCRALGTMSDCAACNQACDTCISGACVVGELSECFVVLVDDDTTCAQRCAANGVECVEACDGYGGFVYVGRSCFAAIQFGAFCDTPLGQLTKTEAEDEGRCCCTPA